MSLRLSVIICTKNRSTDLEITLRSIFEQRLLPDNLVIIDDGNIEETRTILKKITPIPSVRIIYVHPDQQNSGLPAARNQGIKTISNLTEIIVFLDDDVTLEKAYLETISDLFKKNPDVYGITGFVWNEYHCRSPPVKGLMLIASCILPSLIPVSMYGPQVTHTAEALYPLFRKPQTDAVPAEWLSGCNMAYRSTIFIEGFMFDENFVSYALGEDMLFSHKMYNSGKKLLLSYNAHLTHRISEVERIPPFQKLVMKFGYRNYTLFQFAHNRVLSSFWYAVFVMQCILSSVITSIRYRQGQAPVMETIRAYCITREFEQEIKSGNLKRFNAFLSTLT